MGLLSQRTRLLAGLLLLTLSSPVISQTYSSCNPLTQSTCPADPALGKTVNIDFTQGASDSFSASGSPSYGSNGAAFTVAKSGDSPTITSKWYIMFGHVDFVLKAAPGTGIVSSAIMQSDCLDEIDFEWLGGDDAQVQSNYFGKGETTTYNRGAFHAAAGNHDGFHTYSIDWTADQIVWSVDGQTVRVLTPATAETGQYPQTPMQIKVGIWAGGDPSNAAGTIEWAGGEVDYSQGPYTMYLKSVHVQDYSTGSSYSYSGTSGTWESITSSGGTVNSSGKSSASVASQPAVSTASGAPVPLSTSPEQSSIYATRTGFPWVIGSATAATTTSQAVATSYSGLPSGWIITDSGKVVPPSAGPTESLSTYFSSASVWDSQSASQAEITTTTYDQQGFPTLTTITVPATLPTSISQDSGMTSTISTLSTTLTISTISIISTISTTLTASSISTASTTSTTLTASSISTASTTSTTLTTLSTSVTSITTTSTSAASSSTESQTSETVSSSDSGSTTVPKAVAYMNGAVATQGFFHLAMGICIMNAVFLLMRN